MGIKPIALSFKNTPADAELNEWIISHSNMSGFAKDILREAMRKEKGIITCKSVPNSNQSGLIDMDF